MEKKRSKSKRIISLILSLVMVLSSTPIGQRQFVFAAGETPYILDIDCENGDIPSSGFKSASDKLGKTKCLEFKSRSTWYTLSDTTMSEGTAVFEIEMCPADGQETIQIYNSAGNLLFQIVNKLTKIVFSTSSGSEMKTIGTMTQNSGKNLWTKLRLEVYFDENVTDDEGNRILQYKASVWEAPSHSKYGTWVECGSTTQDGIIGKNKGWDNGVEDQTIGSKDNPYDIKTIKISQTSGSKNRYVGDIRLYNITSVEAIDIPTQIIGEDFVTGNSAIAINYSTGYTEYVYLSDLTEGTDYTIDGFDSSAATDSAITINYGDYELPALVSVKGMTGIEVTAPSNTKVNKGEELDTSDMVVEVVFSDGTTTELGSDSYDFSLDTSTKGWTKATVDFGGYTYEFDVLVVGLNSVAVKANPTKTEYLPGEELDFTGLEITESYNDSSTKDLTFADIKTNYDIDSSAVTDVAGTYKILITSKADNSIVTSFDVTIKEAQLTGIKVTAPYKLNYLAGATLDTTGMVVTGIFNNDENVTRVLGSDEYQISAVDLSALGEKTVTVTSTADNNLTDTFAVNVLAVNDIFEYTDGASTDDLDLTVASGSTAIASAIKDNSSNMLKVTGGVATKSWDYDLTTGIVKIDVELCAPDKNGFFNILDKDGNSVLVFGQYGNTNLYNAKAYTAGTKAYSTSGVTYAITAAGNQGYWVRLETEIDLDASNVIGKLQFVTKVYHKSSYTAEWELQNTITGDDCNAATSSLTTNTLANTNGCSNSELTEFSIGAIEFASISSKVSYFDNLYIAATSARTLSKVEITTQPTTTEYALNAATIDLSGLVLTETYSDDAKVTVSGDDIEANYTVTGFDSTTPGEKTIVLTNKKDSTKTVEFTITIKSATLESIVITTNPDKTRYMVGDTTVDVTGMVITGTYSDKTTAVLADTDYEVSAVDFSKAGTATVTVTAKQKKNDGGYASVTFDISIVEAKEIFAYDTDGNTLEGLQIETIGDVALSTSATGNTSETIEVKLNGVATRNWGYDITTGIVNIEAEFYTANKGAFVNILDKNGNPLIMLGEFSKLNLYDSAAYTASTKKYDQSGKNYVTVDGTALGNWIRVEAEIDLDASNAAKELQFSMKVYKKAAADATEWTYVTTVTNEYYKGTAGTTNDKTPVKNANGCATSTLEEFSVGAVEIAAGFQVTTAYFDNIVVEATDTLVATEVKNAPTKTSYAMGTTAELDLTGLVLTEDYDVYTLDLSDIDTIKEKYTITGYDVSTEGTKTITLTHKYDSSVKATFDIVVKKVTLKSIEVTTAPTKTQYYVGDTEVDSTGIVVTGTYDDDSTMILSATEYIVGELNSTVAGTVAVTVAAVAKNAAGEDVTTTFDVTVKEPVVTGIEITTAPSKVQYLIGDTADWSGMVVKAKYDNGAAKAVDASELTLTGFDSSVATDKQTITVTYKTFTATFDIKVVDASQFTVIEKLFDFNIEGSNTAEGWTGIFVNKSKGTKYTTTDYGYSADKGYGFNTTVTDLQGRKESVTANSAYTLMPSNAYNDFVLFANSNGTFDVDIPNGTYNVQIVVGTTNSNTTEMLIEGTYTGKVTRKDNSFQVIDIPNVVVSDGQMNIKALSDSIARTNAIIISNVSAPTGMSAELKTDGEIAVALKWNLSLGCTGYNIYRVHNGVAALVGTVTGMNTTTFKDTNVDCLETYSYFVRGITANNVETMASNSAELIIKDSSVAAPVTPENFKISAMDSAATTLSWSEVDNASYYEVYSISKDADNVSSLAGYTLVGKTTATTYVCDMDGHADMYFKVVAAGLGGKSDATDTAFSDAPAPVTPANLKVSEVTEDATTLTWDASENAVYYEIYWSDRDRDDLEGTNGYELIGKSNTNSFVYELPTHVTRYYKVVAIGAGGRSEATDSVASWIVKEFNVQAEYLDRGLVAIAIDGGVYVGWRLLGNEYAAEASYKLYRDGEVIRTFSATENTSFFDTAGTANSKYTVSVVIDGVEDEKCAEVAVQSTDYLEVPIEAPEAYYDDKLTKEHIKSTYYTNAGSYCENVVTAEQLESGEYTYAANDTYVGDVDGDGVYEIIVKWNGMSRDNSQNGYTSPVYIDCYKLDGTRLWRINLGINIRAGAHYTQPVVADLDGDGKAEIMMRTADGTVDGKGTVIGDATQDYRNSSGHIITGTDYLTLFDGETGAALDTVNYNPQRGSARDWGDNYGGRSERFLSGVAYLDGEHISAIFARGYYTRGVVVAYTVENDKIKEQWVCDSNDAANSALYGQGAHSFTVADVDGDGCQEIVYGSATIDNDGKVMYGLEDLYGSDHGGHGDAERVTDMNLKNPGLEIFMVHEEYPNEGSMEMHDAATGEYIYNVGTKDQDVGRGAAGDIDPNYEGVESWSTIKDTDSATLSGLRDANGNIVAKRPSPVNHMAWFNGDMGREFVDNSNLVPTIGTWNSESQKVTSITLDGCRTNNTTKANAAFQADMFGDWREELAYRTQDNTAIRIYTSTETMDYRLYTLMHDPTYRAQMACNGSAYNQSPDAGFYIGYNTDLMIVPVPTLDVVKAVADEDIEVESIEITATPDKVTYLVGEELDLTGLVVTAKYNNKSSKALTAGEYTVDSSMFDSSVVAEGIVITVKVGEFTDTFTVRVINEEDAQSFYYIDADTVENLGLTGTVNIVADTKNGNDTNKLEIASSTVNKTFDEAITAGKVTVEWVGYQNGKVLSFRILDADGNGLISTAQQVSTGNYNLYEGIATGGEPYQTLCSAKNKWVKTVVVIDLDKSNETKTLQFTMDVYYKGSYSDENWTKAGSFTQDSTYMAAAFGNANGAATDSLTSFNVGAIEFQSTGSSYVDDVFFNDGSGIRDIVTTTSTLKKVEITKPAALTQYTVGSTLNTAGLEITGTYEVTYSDGRTPETKTKVITKYNTEYDFSQITDKAVVKLIITDGENKFELEYSVKVVAKGDGSWVTFEYIDDETAALVGFNGSNVSVTNGEISANDTSNTSDRITLGKGTAVNVFDTPFKTGKVHFETSFMTMATSSASLFLRIMNSEDKPMVDIGQYGSGNLNLYIDENTSGTTGTMAARFENLPVKKWAKMVIDIDLDATAKEGHLVFDAVVYTTDNYASGTWTKFAEFDETVYLNSTTAPTTTGAASSTATVFDVASIELFNAAGSTNYYDDMFFEAMATGITKELTGIKITEEADKTEYVEGDNFDATGLTVMGTYKYTFTDGTTAEKQRRITDYTVEFNNRTIGDNVPVVITVGDFTETYNVKVTRNTVLDGIEAYIVDFVNNDLVTLLEDNIIALNKRQIMLPYANDKDVKLEWAAASENITVENRVVTVTPSTEAKTEAKIKVAIVTQNANGKDITIEREVVFEVAKATASGTPTIKVDMEKAVETMMEMGLFKDQERLDSVTAIMSQLEGKITVEEFVAMLVILYGVDTTYTDTVIARDDIDYDAWYADYVIAAYQLSLETEASRMGKESYGIGDNLTKEDILYMLSRIIAVDKTTLPADYATKMFE